MAVTATEGSDLKGGAKAGISIFGAKVGSSLSAQTENVSRLTFAVPVVFPSTHVATPKDISDAKHREVLKKYHPRNEE